MKKWNKTRPIFCPSCEGSFVGVFSDVRAKSFDPLEVGEKNSDSLNIKQKAETKYYHGDLPNTT